MRRPGIIPARAGFTHGKHHGAGEGTDHPRSRGVYDAPAAPRVGRAGSSPLARGLPQFLRDGVRRLRIIPARAGFTVADSTGSPATPDHPRSRGVYRTRDRHLGIAHGSSPLARGLPPPVTPGHRGSADHPRSRGVYLRADGTCGLRHGSSPLARGLQARGDAGGLAPRIIPARAGFTFALSGGLGEDQDHPRSRGVYPTSPLTTARASGSSPLARGLRLVIIGGPDGSRIIPARAGFTNRKEETMDAQTDHPRSRGVYPPQPGWKAKPAGSSPLARGLPAARSQCGAR